LWKINEVMEMPGPMVRRVQRKATKYDRLLTNRTTKLNQRIQAFDQRAQPRRQHIENLQGQIATREEARQNLITDKANLLGQIRGSRLPSIHLIKKARARILQVRINSKNRQIERRTKRIARQERIINRHMTKAAAHTGAIQILEADRQALRAPLAQEQEPGQRGEPPEPGAGGGRGQGRLEPLPEIIAQALGGGRRPGRRMVPPRTEYGGGRGEPERPEGPQRRNMPLEERARVAAELRRIRENIRRRRAAARARGGGEQDGIIE
jgi:hypothetical protein